MPSNASSFLLVSAERPVIMFGKGAAWSGAGAALSALVSLGLPFIASPMGRGTVPDDDPPNAGGARAKGTQQLDPRFLDILTEEFGESGRKLREEWEAPTDRLKRQREIGNLKPGPEKARLQEDHLKERQRVHGLS